MRIHVTSALFLLLLVGCNDTTRVFFEVASQSVPETAGSTEITVQLNRSPKIGASDFNAPNSITNQEIKVPFTVSGTAQFGTNHGLTNGTIVFQPNSRTAKIRVPVFHNVAFEGDKALILSLGEPVGASLGDLTTHTLTIQETDLSPTVDISTPSQTVSEGAGTVSIPITLSYASQAEAVIPFAFSGTAIQGTDFTAATNVTIPAGQTTGNILITLIDNLVINPNKTIIVNLGNPSEAHLGTSISHTITVVDNDNNPTVSLSSPSQSVSEGAGSVTVTFSMSKTSLLDVTIPYSISGTASSPADHNLSDGTLTIPAGNTSGSISFNVVNDTMDEPNETVIVTLGSIVNGNVGSPSSQTITILDDDPPPTIQFSTASQSVSEAVGTVTVQVNLSAVSSQSVQVPFTVSGTAANPSDHNLVAGTFTIPAGSSSASTLFSVVDDNLYESNETIVVTLGSPTNATASGATVQTITINNNDPAPIVNFQSISQSVSEGNSGSTTLNLTVEIDKASGVSTSIPFSVSGTATSGADFSVSTASPLVIAAGETTGSLTVSVTGDITFENDETVILTLGSPTNGTLGAKKTHTLTLTNDDPLPSVSFSASAQTVSEGAGAVYVLFVMSNPSAFTVTIPYTVSGTASYPADHNLQSGSTTILAGTTERVFTFTVVNDAVVEPTETVVLTLGSITNGTAGTPSTHTVSISDNDRKFSLKNTKLWLDAGYGISGERESKRFSWIPRYSRNPIKFTDIFGSIWKCVEGSKPPVFELSDWGWLASAFEKDPRKSEADSIYVVYGSDYNQDKISYRDMPLWMKQFTGGLSELIWVAPDPNEQDTTEIEAYLKKKYLLQNEP